MGPPAWIGQSFEVFRLEVESWERVNKDDTLVKYRDLVESLKKNDKHVKDYIAFVLEMTKDVGNQTVKNVLDLLADKYAKTKTERSIDLAKDVFEFEMRENESCEVYLQRFQKMM